MKLDTLLIVGQFLLIPFLIYVFHLWENDLIQKTIDKHKNEHIRISEKLLFLEEKINEINFLCTQITKDVEELSSEIKTEENHIEKSFSLITNQIEDLLEKYLSKREN